MARALWFSKVKLRRWSLKHVHWPNLDLPWLAGVSLFVSNVFIILTLSPIGTPWAMSLRILPSHAYGQQAQMQLKRIDKIKNYSSHVDMRSLKMLKRRDLQSRPPVLWLRLPRIKNRDTVDICSDSWTGTRSSRWASHWAAPRAGRCGMRKGRKKAPSNYLWNCFCPKFAQLSLLWAFSFLKWACPLFFVLEVASLQGQIAESPEGLEKARGTLNPFGKFSRGCSKCQEIDELKSGVRQLKVTGLVLVVPVYPGLFDAAFCCCSWHSPLY